MTDLNWHEDGAVLDIIWPSDLENADQLVIHAFPHSGRVYPNAFMAKSRIKDEALRASEDAFVDLLVGFRPDKTLKVGQAALRANLARAYVDVNRHALELDAQLIQGRLPADALSQSIQARAGYGVVARCIKAGIEIYERRITISDVRDRIEQGHRPYHQALTEMLAMARRSGKPALVLDWHSMPSELGSNLAKSKGGVDIVLGNCHDTSARVETSDRLLSAFKAQGFRVAFNTPFAGGFTTKTYGQPDSGVEAVQIEINRALYRDERLIRPNAAFADIASRINTALVSVGYEV